MQTPPPFKVSISSLLFFFSPFLFLLSLSLSLSSSSLSPVSDGFKKVQVDLESCN